MSSIHLNDLCYMGHSQDMLQLLDGVVGLIQSRMVTALMSSTELLENCCKLEPTTIMMATSRSWLDKV